MSPQSRHPVDAPLKKVICKIVDTAAHYETWDMDAVGRKLGYQGEHPHSGASNLKKATTVTIEKLEKLRQLCNQVPGLKADAELVSVLDNFIEEARSGKRRYRRPAGTSSAEPQTVAAARGGGKEQLTLDIPVESSKVDEGGRWNTNAVMERTRTQNELDGGWFAVTEQPDDEAGYRIEGITVQHDGEDLKFDAEGWEVRAEIRGTKIVGRYDVFGLPDDDVVFRGNVIRSDDSKIYLFGYLVSLAVRLAVMAREPDQAERFYLEKQAERVQDLSQLMTKTVLTTEEVIDDASEASVRAFTARKAVAAATRPSRSRQIAKVIDLARASKDKRSSQG